MRDLLTILGDTVLAILLAFAVMAMIIGILCLFGAMAEMRDPAPPPPVKFMMRSER